MKVVYSDRKIGKTSQVEVPKGSEAMLIGKRIGEAIEGAGLGLEGFKLQITGLSDTMGAPSRKEVEGSRKARILLNSGPGIKRMKRGKRMRRLIRGNTVSAETGQINTVIVEYGSKGADELFPKKEKAEAEKKV